MIVKSLVTNEENTKEIMSVICVNFNFDFLVLYNMYF